MLSGAWMTATSISPLLNKMCGLDFGPLKPKRLLVEGGHLRQALGVDDGENRHGLLGHEETVLCVA
jgi:hypothetical protein